MKRLIAGLVAGLVLALPLSAEASAIEKDKAEHFGAGMAVDYAEAALFPKWTPLERFLGVVAIGGAKEWYDHNHPSRHSADWGDIAADAVGAVSAEGTIWLVHKSF